MMARRDEKICHWPQSVASFGREAQINWRGAISARERERERERAERARQKEKEKETLSH